MAGVYHTAACDRKGRKVACVPFNVAFLRVCICLRRLVNCCRKNSLTPGYKLLNRDGLSGETNRPQPESAANFRHLFQKSTASITNGIRGSPSFPDTTTVGIFVPTSRRVWKQCRRPNRLSKA